MKKKPILTRISGTFKQNMRQISETIENLSFLSDCFKSYQDLFVYLDFNVAFNTVQVISQRVVLWTEETSTYSWSRFCAVHC